MSNPEDPKPGRRNFLSHASAMAALAPAALAAAPAPAQESHTAAKAEVLTTERPGADFMIDVFKSLGFEYVCANPGSAFRAIQESVVNYGGNTKPEFLTCLHEESSVAMGHGYFKVEGKPLLVFAHGTVGLQHASMAIYNAFCDRVPVFIVLGNNLNAATRRSNIDWVHSVQDAASLVRDFTKFDDSPISLHQFAESSVRAYKIAMTAPSAPVVLVADADLADHPIEGRTDLTIPKLANTSPPTGDPAAVGELADMLMQAQRPVIVAGRLARTPAGMAHLIELAELLQSPVVDLGMRMNFPNRHRLNLSPNSRALVENADLVLGLEVPDFYGLVNRISRQLEYSSQLITKAKLACISAGDRLAKSNYQDFQRYQPVDLDLAADAEATLPSLVEAVKKRMTGDRRRAFEARGAEYAKQHAAMREKARVDASYAWDASPVSVARMCAEIWAQIKNEDWCLVNGSTNFLSNWPLRLWNFDKSYRHIGSSGGAGMGYGAPAAVGAALANKKYGRVSVNIQTDGDLMYAPGVLWTAAHHRIPLLTIMHNNRAYHQELMEVQIAANQHNRGIDRAHIGTTIDDPNINYAKLAESMGMMGIGPIEKPDDLGPAIRRGVEAVKRGEPVLIDVVTQPR
ncbi:MAG: thiamine pyrophosphate-binding protein [Acidobacteria bacterium]|nr:thiamine pyrophosphate-binding protein [Acidobacteriota bacterium]